MAGTGSKTTIIYNTYVKVVNAATLGEVDTVFSSNLFSVEASVSEVVSGQCLQNPPVVNNSTVL